MLSTFVLGISTYDSSSIVTSTFVLGIFTHSTFVLGIYTYSTYVLEVIHYHGCLLHCIKAALSLSLADVVGLTGNQRA